MLRKIAQTKNVAGVIVHVNSPGGTTTGGEAIYEELRKVSEKKPVVAQFGTVAASAGYIVGLVPTTSSRARQYHYRFRRCHHAVPEVGDLLSKVGVKMNEVKSGDLKASPSMFAPADQPSLVVVREMIDDGFRWFASLVETRRGIKLADVPGLEQGRIFSGREALAKKLVDEIGGEVEANAGWKRNAAWRRI